VPPGFVNSHAITVRFAETDAQGIAHHASFVVWLEVARVAYLAEHAGGYKSIRDRGIEALTTGVHIDYHRAAYFDDLLTVWLRCVDVRGARFRYEYRIERESELIAEASTSHATVERVSRRPTRVPAWLAEAVARAEARTPTATAP
jgi:acyl-CoA thioester hydrolase